MLNSTIEESFIKTKIDFICALLYERNIKTTIGLKKFVRYGKVRRTQHTVISAAQIMQMARIDQNLHKLLLVRCRHLVLNHI